MTKSNLKNQLWRHFSNIIVLRHRNTSQDFFILGPSQLKFLATPVSSNSSSIRPI